MFCPKCSSLAFYKHGFVISKGSKIQRYCCKNCGCQFSKSNHSRFDFETKKLAYKMYKEGLGFRSIGRVLNVSFMTVIKWIKNFALELKKALVNTEVPNEFDIIQIDEIFSYVKKKSQKRFIWIAFNQARSRVIDYEIGDRSTKTLDKLYTRLESTYKIKYYGTDHYASYSELISFNKHKKGKKFTQGIESQNARIRHYLRGFTRRSKGYFKDINSMQNALDLHFWGREVLGY